MNKLVFAATALLMSSGVASAVTFSGTASGAWIDPVGTVGFAIANNDLGGTADVDWGTPGTTPFNNLWSFDGVGSDGLPGWTADAGNLFKIGDFSYRNGSVFGHNFGGASLEVTLDITSPLSNTSAFSFAFDVINTPNITGDPVLDGDIASIINSVSSTVFQFNGANYTLELFGFSQDGGLTITSQFNSPEGSTARAELFGRIIEPAVIPVPAGLPLLLAGIGAFALVKRRKSVAQGKH